MIELHNQFLFLLILSGIFSLALLFLFFYFSHFPYMLISTLLLKHHSFSNLSKFLIKFFNLNRKSFLFFLLFIFLPFGPIKFLFFFLIIFLLPIIPHLNFLDYFHQTSGPFPDSSLLGPNFINLVPTKLLLILQRQVLGHQLLPYLNLFLKFLLQLILLILISNFNFLQPFYGFLLINAHLQSVSHNNLPNLPLLLLQLLRLIFHLLQILLNLIGSLYLFLCNFVAGGNTGLVTLDVGFC